MPPHVFKEQLRKIFNVKLTPQVLIFRIHVRRENVEEKTVMSQ